jgi:6-phosphofructokinase 1
MEQVCDWIRSRFRTNYSPIVVAAEGAVPEAGTLSLASGEVDAFGHVRLGGVGNQLAGEIEARTGQESRAVVLGHIQRGGTPTAFDRWLATRFGLHAIDAVAAGDTGVMVALHGIEIVRVALADATTRLKTVPPEKYEEAKIFFG